MKPVDKMIPCFWNYYMLEIMNIEIGGAQSGVSACVHCVAY